MTTGVSVRGRSVGASVRGRSAGASVRGRSAGASVRGRSAGASVRGRSVGVRAQRGRSVGVRGQRGRSVGVRARRAQSVGDDRGRSQDGRGRSLRRDGRGSQSRYQSRDGGRSKSSEGVPVLGAPRITTKITQFAQAVKFARERRLILEKERKEGKYFGMVLKLHEQKTAEGTAIPPMEQLWADPAAVIACAGEHSPEKSGSASPEADSAEKTGSTSPDMFNFDKKQDLFD